MILGRAYLTHPEFRLGARDMLGVAPGIAAWGLMTGVAMVKSGMGMVESLVMAVIVYAGSAQLASIPLILAGAPIGVILATALCVNLRFVVFSVHLRPYMMHLPLRDRLLAGYLTGDLTYVLFVKRFASPDVDAQARIGQMAYLLGNGGVNWLSWTICSVLGVVAAHSVPTHWGLGFAGILALLGMMCSLTTTRLRWLAAAVAGSCAVVAYALPLKLNILVAIAVAVPLCVLLERSPLGGAPARGGH